MSKHDEHNNKPWYKRFGRWSAPSVKYIVGAVLILFVLGMCDSAQAGSVSIGPAQTKYPDHASGGTYCFDNSFKYCVAAEHHGPEDRSPDRYEPNRHVNVVSAWYRSTFRDEKRWRPYTAIGLGYANATTRTQSTKLNFYLRAGVLYVREKWFLDVAIRHDSNAALKKPNSGRDRAGVEIGYRF